MMRRLFVVVMMVALILAVLPVHVGAQDDETPTYGVRGPYPVGTMEFVIEGEERPLPLTVWYPAQEGVEETTYVHEPEFATVLPTVEQPGHAIPDGTMELSGAPYPLVIYSHGNMWYRHAAAYLAEHLASHGFVVMAADHIGNTLAFNATTGAPFIESIVDALANRPGDIQRQIDYATVLTAEGGALDGMIDTERIAVTGHSYGGYTALAAAGARVDMTPVHDWCDSVASDPAIVGTFGYVFFCNALSESEADLQASLGFDVGIGGLWPAFDVEGVDVVIALAPGALWVSTAESLAEVTIPVMVMAAGQDSTAVYELNAGPVYENLPGTNKTLVVFDGAEHFLFAASCFGYFDQICLECCTDPTWDMEQAHDLINHFATAFLLAELYDDTEAAAALAPEAVTFPGITYETTGF
jgi:predicted dienelactone hydrolase